MQDTQPPRIKKIEATPGKLWPVNNRLVPVTLSVRAEDCSPFHCRIISVRSNQAVGNEPDWVITGDLTLKLRAQRSGHQERVYTVTVECRDAKGNASHRSVKIVVPRKHPNDHDNGDNGDNGDDGHDGNDDRDNGHDRD